MNTVDERRLCVHRVCLLLFSQKLLQNRGIWLCTCALPLPLSQLVCVRSLLANSLLCGSLTPRVKENVQ